MGLIQQLQYGASQDQWDSWMSALVNWAQNQDDITTGLPVTKQGVTNIMEMSGSTSNAFLLYFVDSLPPQPSFSNQVVYNGSDGRVYAWHNTLNKWVPTGATAFDQLTGFLQAGQILIGNQINICTNGCCTNDAVGSTPSGWSTNSSYSNAPVLCVAGSSAPAGCPTNNCLYIQGRDTNFVAGGGFDVKPNEVYYLEGYMGSDGTTPGMNVGLYFPAVGSSGPQWTAACGAPPRQTGWITQNGLITVPTWANRAQVWLQVNASSSQPSGYGNNWFTGIECVKASANTFTTGATNVFCASNAVTQIFSFQFVTYFASVISVNVWGSGSGANALQLNPVLDGTTLVNEIQYFTPGTTTSNVFLVTIPGTHTLVLNLSVPSGNSNVGARVGLVLLSLLK